MAISTVSFSQAAFKHHFDALVPLILSEWPQLIESNLLETAGDLDLAVAYISGETDHTQTLTRHHLAELATLVQPAGNDAAPVLPATEAEATEPSTVDQLLSDLETRTEHLIDEFKAEMLPELEKKARSNLGTSLLIALGLGFILGLLLGGKRG
ncbi:hypothetical protein IQ254_24995 [Nodosilinea sp. LEGE 07088]|uniref:hypothetical protein n=1 Tax=Nodosilinea sp. LEGE 07088 TaxID=2777968 RepID=UPI0018808730|nr:hypothetical protein [Nodosilinea sp. LEGE 07088]MBE9140418.1 hypothetical protein [Nodosilinea sp. LEGE 07088]